MSNQNDNIGQAWVDSFRDHNTIYRFTAGLPYLRRFLRGPFMQLPLRYAALRPGSRVLEAGCGSGKFSFCFALLGHQVTALDFSADILSNVRAAKADLEKAGGPLHLTTYQGDLEQLDLPDEHFDLVINEGVVEHWLDQTARRRVLAGMVRVTKPGGVVAVIIPNGSHPFIDTWVRQHPAFVSAPPMVNYTPPLLTADLSSVGLTQLEVDGIYAWRTLSEWPRTQLPYRLAGSALDHLIPLPRAVRRRWGLHLIGLGRKA